MREGIKKTFLVPTTEILSYNVPEVGYNVLIGGHVWGTDSDLAPVPGRLGDEGAHLRGSL